MKPKQSQLDTTCDDDLWWLSQIYCQLNATYVLNGEIVIDLFWVHVFDGKTWSLREQKIIVYIEISAFAMKDSGQYASTDQNKTITAGC